MRTVPKQGACGPGKNRTMEKATRKGRQKARQDLRKQEAPRVTIGDATKGGAG